MKYLKEYNDINFDDFDWEEEYDIKDEIKQYLIDHPEEHYHTNVISFFHRKLKKINGLDAGRLNDLFGTRNKYTKLFDDIDYDKIQRDSIVMANVPNINRRVKKYVIASVDKSGWRINYNHYHIYPYNIKKVIKY